MHPHSAHSDLARINNAPLYVPTMVHPSTCELLQLAQRLHTLTDGVFDPCLPYRPGHLQDIVVDSDCQIVCRAAVALDFGGFAKGYAVDRAVDALVTNGCSAGLVNAGGDLRVFGPQADPILMRGPNGALTPLALNDAALAVSDAASYRRPAEHNGYYNRASVTSEALFDHFAAVAAPTACIADALVKCVMLCSKDRSTQVLREFGATRISSG
jgi:thiamine biosynthesis lipoprotein